MHLPFHYPDDPLTEIDEMLVEGIGPATRWLLDFITDNGSLELWPDKYVDELNNGKYKHLFISEHYKYLGKVPGEKVVKAP